MDGPPHRTASVAAAFAIDVSPENIYFVSDVATCNFDFKILLEEPQKL